MNKNQMHLIPQILIDRGEQMLTKYGNTQTKENYAQQLEVVKEYCKEVLEKYRKVSKTKHKATV